MLERIKDIYYGLKDFTLIFLYGFFIGLLISYLTFSYIHFSIIFKLFSGVVLFIIFVIKLIRLKIYSDSLLWAGMFLQTFIIHFTIISVLGAIWVFLAEDFYMGFYETLVLTILLPLVMIGTIIIFLFRLVWNQNVISKTLDNYFDTFWFLLGFRK